MSFSGLAMGSLDSPTKSTGLYSGGNGETQDEAVVINTANHFAGVSAEYEYISRQCGQRGVDWTLVSQTLIQEDDGRRYDRLIVRLKDGETRTFYFDITPFFGRY